jgi:hypothetical protein
MRKCAHMFQKTNRTIIVTPFRVTPIVRDVFFINLNPLFFTSLLTFYFAA